MKEKIAVSFFVIGLLLNVSPIVGLPLQIIRDDFTITYKETNIESVFIPGEFIIKFREGTDVHISVSQEGFLTTGISSLDILNTEYNVTSAEPLFKSILYLSMLNVYKFTLNEDGDILSIVDKYNIDPSVEYAEPNCICHTCGDLPTVIPNDELFESQWGLHNIGQDIPRPPHPPIHGTPDADIDAPEAWDIEIGSPNVTIAIIDTGVDYNHPDLADNIWNNIDEIPDNGVDDDNNGFTDDTRGWDFVNDDNDPMDDYGHGTHCSGIAAAVTNNSIGIAGVCWNCKIMPLKVLNYQGSGTWEGVANAIYYAGENGADVISMSLGNYEYSETVKNAINYTYYEKGVVHVAGAGNLGANEKLYPAAYNNVIAVAATDIDDKKFKLSNWGPWVDVAAPGVYIYSTKLGNGYKYDSGTSMACPYVAGLAALILSKNPDFNNEDVSKIIRQRVDRVNQSYDNPEYIGTGRINAHDALYIPVTDAVAKILSPSWYDVFSKETTTNIEITGTAMGDNYTVEYGKGVYPQNWNIIATGTPINDSFAVIWNISGIPYGMYQIRLSVSDDTGVVTDLVLVYLAPLTLEWQTLFGGNFANAPIGEDLDLDGVVEIVLYDRDLSHHNWLVCLNGTTGEKEWEYPLHSGWDCALPAVGDIDDNGEYEVLAGINWGSVEDPKGQLYAFASNGTLLWEHIFYTSFIGECITLSDLNNDGKLEILVGAEGGVYCFNYSGDVLWSNLDMNKTAGFFAVGDLTSDGSLEIIATNRGDGGFVYCLDCSGNEVWSYYLAEDGWISSNPILADSDGDGFLEVFIGGEDKDTPGHPRLLYCFNSSGSIKWKSEDINFINSLSAADIDNDDFPEVVCSGELGLICIYDGCGIQKWENHYMGGNGNPIIVDYDNDSNLDIICGCEEGSNNKVAHSHFFAIGDSGTYEWYYPPLHGWFSTPSSFFVGDIDNDGKLEMIVNPSAFPDSYVYCFEFEVEGGELVWPMFQHDPHRTGLYDNPVPYNNPPDPPTIDGATYVEKGIGYNYTFSAVDLDVDDVYLWVEWGDGSIVKWIGPYESGEEVILNHAWDNSGTYTIKVRAMDIHGRIGEWETLEIVSYNTPPYPPIIDGPTEGKVGVEYWYNFTTTDPNGDDVYYYIVWGDGTNTSWLGPYASGESITLGHTWYEKETYIISAKAKDVYGAEGDWGYLEVEMPINIFGYTTSASLSVNIKNRISGSNFTILGNGTADSITAYIHTDLSVPPKTKCMIYRVNDSVLVGETENKTLNTGSDPDWVTYNFSDPKPVLVKDTEYALVCWSNDTCDLLYDNATSELGLYSNQNYGNAPSSINWTANESRVYSIFCGYSTIPEITNVTASPVTVGFGFNVTISADIYDNACGMDNVTVNITYPDNDTGNFTMNNTENNLYEYVFNDTWLVGQYNYTIWAVDKSGSTNSSSGHSFNVSVQTDMSVCTVKDEYGNNEITNLTDPPSDPPLVGYELLDDGNVLHIWNKYDNYYFNTSSGIQITNHYNEYWSHNVLMLGYYDNEEWNVIYRTDELSDFNKNIDTDNETYVNATLWKDLTYGGYDFRLAIRYHLGVDDNELTVIPYIKNLGEAIPYVLGFAWEIKDIQVDMTPEGDYIEINGTSFYLNESVDITFRNMTVPIYCWNETTNESYVCGYEPIPYFYIREDKPGNRSESLYLRWNESLDYVVRVKSRDGEYNAPVTLAIRIGTLNVNQEKFTELLWHDASEVTYYFNSYDNFVDWSTSPGNMVDGSTSNYASTTTDSDVELCNGNTCSGSDLGRISKVEVRCFGKYSGFGQWPPDIIIRPVFLGGDGSNHVFDPSTTGDWSSWFDITSDPNSPGTWSWTDVDNLDCDVEASIDGIYTLYCSKVEVRVTYTPNNAPIISNPYPSDGSTGISISPTLNITVSDPDGDSMTVTWRSNSSGSWQVFGTNNSVGNGTYRQTFSNATVNGQWWYWLVNVTDGTNYTESYVYKFYTGYQSKIENTGSTVIKGYLLIQAQFYNTTFSTWVVANDTINEISPRTINWDDPYNMGEPNILALDTIFNGLVNTSNLSEFGNGTYRIYAAFRDPEGNILVCDDETQLVATYEFTITFE